MQNNKDTRFEMLALEILLKEKNKYLRCQLYNLFNEIIQGTIEMVDCKWEEEFLEMYLQKDEKEIYLKLYQNCDYIFFADTF